MQSAHADARRRARAPGDWRARAPTSTRSGCATDRRSRARSTRRTANGCSRRSTSRATCARRRVRRRRATCSSCRSATATRRGSISTIWRSRSVGAHDPERPPAPEPWTTPIDPFPYVDWNADRLVERRSRPGRRGRLPHRVLPLRLRRVPEHAGRGRHGAARSATASATSPATTSAGRSTCVPSRRPTDLAYTAIKLLAHTDQPYRQPVPGHPAPALPAQRGAGRRLDARRRTGRRRGAGRRRPGRAPRRWSSARPSSATTW